MSLITSPYQKAKKQSKYGRCTVSDLKNQIRNEFKEKLQHQRNKLRDLRRGALEATVINSIVTQGYCEIKRSLLQDVEAAEMLDINRVMNLLNEVQGEILAEEEQLQAENYQRDLDNEVKAVVNTLLTTCNVCDKIVDNLVPYSNVICNDCSDIFRGDQ